MNCDRIARWYAAMEYASFGSALLKTRCKYLQHCRDARTVLMLGEGDGRFLERFLQLNAHASVDYIDVSKGMLAEAKRRGGVPRVRFHQSDLRYSALPSQGYDLVITHFFLDCLTSEEVSALVNQIERSCAPGTRWIISEFTEPSTGWRRIRARAWIAFLYTAFRLLTQLHVTQLPEYESALNKAGFRKMDASTANAELLKSELWQLLPAEE